MHPTASFFAAVCSRRDGDEECRVMAVTLDTFMPYVWKTRSNEVYFARNGGRHGVHNRDILPCRRRCPVRYFSPLDCANGSGIA